MLGSNVGISPPTRATSRHRRHPKQGFTDNDTVLLCVNLSRAQSKIARKTMFCLSNSKAKQWTALSVIASILISRKFQVSGPSTILRQIPKVKN